MEKVELAWAAGFFDGEGSVGCYKSRRSSSRQYYVLQASVGQLEKSTLDRFCAAVGVGRVSLRALTKKSNLLSNKPLWYWRAYGYAKIFSLFNTLSPFLSEPKTLQFKQALASWEEYKGKTKEKTK